MSAPPPPPAARPPPRGRDDEGVYRARGQFSVAVLGVYAFLLIVLFLVVVPREPPGYLWVPYVLVAAILFFVARYLTTSYRIDDTHLRATRLFGGRRIALEQVRRIEYSALRDLAPTGAMAALGPIGWRGRMWSPSIGQFDSVFTEAGQGILVTAGGNPLYISPVRREEFARELSRRVRSYTGPLEQDVGHPGPG